MFKKKPHIKPLAPLRSSDRRKTADQIISTLGIDIPKAAEADAEDKAASTASLTSLRNALLPDNAQSARFTTTAGPDLKQVSGTVYVGSHGTEEQRILWVKIEERLYPTVYTLWRNPGILPLLHTPSIVVEKLQGGADLMTPGLARGPPFPPKAKKGAIVAVASLETPSVPMAVGVCEIDVSALQKVQGAKGHAVQTVHWAGDELWGWSNSGNPGGAIPDSIQGWDDNKEVFTLASQADDLTIDDGDEDGGVSLTAEANPTETIAESSTSLNDLVEVVPEKELTTKDIDNAFRNAFLYGVRHHMDINKAQQNFGLQFPLTQSYVMSTLVQPFLPAYTPSQASVLQIKKTSWKNIKKFVKSLDKERIVKSKDRDGHEVVILDIDFSDRHIRDFVPYRLPKKEPPAGSGSGGGTAAPATDGSDPSIGQKLQKVQLYRPKDKHAPILSAAGADPRGFFTAAEIRQVATTYIEGENLVASTNKRIVKLDPILANALFDGTATIDKEVLSKGTVPRDALADRLLSACSPFHLIVRNNEQSASAKPKAGQPPRILITLETRSGNKTVTKISGVEGYFIPPQPLADELRKTCAGSTSVDKLIGSSAKNPQAEIMVQGPQKDAVIKALEKRGVNKAWVEVVDKTKGKKKG